MTDEIPAVTLTEDEISQLDTACYGVGEYPCCEHYLTREDKRIYLGSGRGTVIPKGTRQGGEMVDAVAAIVAARVAAAVTEVLDRIRADRHAEIARLGADKVRASAALNNWVYGIGIGACHALDVLENRPARPDHRPHDVNDAYDRQVQR